MAHRSQAAFASHHNNRDPPQEAARLFSRSAEEGDAEAQYAIAVMYRTGKGQARDLDKSRAWLQRSAGQRYPPAQAALAAETTTQ